MGKNTTTLPNQKKLPKKLVLLYDAVRDNQPQVPVELNIFKDCKHAIDPQSAENSIKFYDAVLSWLIKYL